MNTWRVIGANCFRVFNEMYCLKSSNDGQKINTHSKKVKMKLFKKMLAQIL